MANPEHLGILERGANTWNKWRKGNPGTQPDLSGVSISHLPLHDVDLSGVNLDHAHLDRQVLNNTDLTGANLSGAELREAVLLRSQLSKANLSGGGFTRALFIGANLSGANLCRAVFYSANLFRANLRDARLEDADMRQSVLAGVDLTHAKLTGAKLYGTARDDWIINGVECRYVFWDAKGEIRSPKDRDLAPSEFEQLYRTLPTIEYVFQNRMSPLDPLIMDRVVQAIRVQNPEYDIQIDSISARGLAPLIKFTVLLDEYKEAALAEVTRRYDTYIERLEADKHRLSTFLAQALETNRLQTLLLTGIVERIGDNIHAEAGANVATHGASINIEYINNAIDLQKIIAQEPEDSPTFANVAKKTALDIIGSALKDVAKGQVKDAAKQIYELSKDLGPVIVNTAAYAFFRSCLG